MPSLWLASVWGFFNLGKLGGTSPSASYCENVFILPSPSRGNLLLESTIGIEPGRHPVHLFILNWLFQAFFVELSCIAELCQLYHTIAILCRYLFLPRQVFLPHCERVDQARHHNDMVPAAYQQPPFHFQRLAPGIEPGAMVSKTKRPKTPFHIELFPCPLGSQLVGQ